MRPAVAALLLPVVAFADTSIPTAGPQRRGAPTGIAAATPNAGGTAIGGSTVGVHAPARWLAPCAARLERAGGKLGGRRAVVVEDAGAETVTLDLRCDGDDRGACPRVWAMISQLDSSHGDQHWLPTADDTPIEPLGWEWANHKNGARTGSWDLRRRSLRLEGWVEVNGARSAAAVSLLQHAVDECLALDDGNG